MRRHRILGALGSCLCVTALLAGAPARASSQSGVVLSPVSVHLNPTTFGTVQFTQGSKQGCLVGTLPRGALALIGGFRQVHGDVESADPRRVTIKFNADGRPGGRRAVSRIAADLTVCSGAALGRLLIGSTHVWLDADVRNGSTGPTYTDAGATFISIKGDTRFGRVVARRSHGRASVSVPLTAFNVDPTLRPQSLRR